MEPGDVFANDMEVGRPQAVEAFHIGAITSGCDVVQERVEPHINGVAFVEGDLDAPILT